MPLRSGNSSQLRLLGCLRLEATDAAHHQLNQRPRLLGLLAILAVARSDGVSRDRLMALLWPESDAPKARNALNQSVFAVRQALGESALVSEGASLRLDEQTLPSDVGLLFDAASEGRDDDVLSLAAGDFLDGAHVVPGDGFERWVDERRAAIRQTILVSLRRLADRARREGHTDRLVSALRRRIAFTPLETDAVIELMEALDASGDASAALAVAAEHAGVVAREFETAPSARVIVLERQIRQRSAALSTDAVLVPPGEDPPTASPAKVRDPEFSPSTPRRRRRLGRMAAITAIAALAASVLFVARRRPAAVATGGTVAIFPFETAPEDSALMPLRERIADLLALRLEGETGPRPLDASALRRTLGDKWNRISPAKETALLAAARFHNATLMIVGDVVGSNSLLSVHARVQRVADGAVLATTEVTGPVDSLTKLVDQLASEIGVIATGVPTWRLSDFRAQTPEALRAYADGRRLLRESRLDDAAKAFRTALDIEPTFASAALGAAEAGAFSHVTDWSSFPWLTRAYALRSHLVERDRLLFDALIRAPGTPKSARDELDGWARVTEELPERAEAWYELGDRLYHEGQRLGEPNWKARARSAFASALQRDSTLNQARAHLAELMALDGDIAGAHRVLAPAPQQENYAFEYARWFIEAQDASRRGLDRTSIALGDLSHPALVRIATGAQLFAIAPEDVTVVMEVLRAHERVGVDRFADIALRHYWSLNRGDTVAAANALELLRADEESGRKWSYAWVSADHEQVLDALFWHGATVAGRAAALRLERGGRVQVGAESPRSAPDRAVLALWSLAHGDTARARSYLADVPRQTTDLALLAANVALLQATHSGQLRNAVLVTDSLLARGPYEFGAYFAPLVVAKAWRALKQPDRAVNTLERRSNDWVESTAFLAPILEEERGAAVEANDILLAKSLQAHLKRLGATRAGPP